MTGRRAGPAALEDVRYTGGVLGKAELITQQCEMGCGNRWKSNVIQHEGRRGDGGRCEDGMASALADARTVRLQPEDPLEARLGRLPLYSAPARRM